MTLDLYYKNFASLGEPLENMYKEFLMDEITLMQRKQQPTVAKIEDVQVDNVKKTDRDKVHESLEKLKIAKANTSQQRKQPITSPRSPLPSPQVTSPSPTGRRNAIPLRSSNSNRNVNVAPSNHRQPPQQQQQQQHRDVAPKKPSPQSLRQRNSPPKPQSHHETNSNYSPSRKPQRSHFERSPRRANNSNKSPVPSSHQRNRRSHTPNHPQQHQYTNGNHNTSSNGRARVNSSQSNSNHSSPQEKATPPRSVPTTPTKYKKPTNLHHSPLEQIENFSWASESEIDDLDKSASPKAQNPYTNSFLNFLAGGQ